MSYYRRSNLSLAFWLSCSILAFAPLSRSIADAAESGIIETYVGSGNGDGAAAINATIDPRGLAVAGDPNAPDVYIADPSNSRVRRVDGRSGLIETVAGNGIAGFAGDGGQAQNASLSSPYDVAIDGAGNIYIAEVQSHRIRKVGTDGRITTLAGNGQQTYNGEGGSTQHALNQPNGVAVGPDGNVYIADTGNNRIRKVSPPGCSPPNCSISTVAGNGTGGLGGEGGQATAANLTTPSDVAFDPSGNMYIVDRGSHRIRRVANGIITTVAGGGTSLADGVPGTQSSLNAPSQVDCDSNGNVYIADSNYRRIRMLQAGSFIISTVAGTGNAGSTGDGGAATRADLYTPFGVAATTPGTFWLAQGTNQPISQYNRVRKVTNNIIQSVIGGGLGSGGAALDAFVDPQGGEAVNAGGALPDLYFADGLNNVVRHVDGGTATIRTLAGTGAAGYGGDGGQAVNATLGAPKDVARDPNNGVVYIADSNNNVIRRINTNGTIGTAAGDGGWGFNGDGSARQVHLAAPLGIDVDRNGALYIADTANNRVRRVAGDQITTVAGNGMWASTGDNGQAKDAALRNPTDVVVTDDNTLYIADTGSQRIRRVSPSGIITTYAGTGFSGFAGDGGQATLAKLYDPTYLSLDASRNLFIADSANKRVRRVDAATQIIQTVAGNGQSGVSGDGGQSTAASFSEPTGIAVDPAGTHLFIAADLDGCIRDVDFGGSPPPPPPSPTPTPGSANFSLSGQISYYADGRVLVPNVAVALTGPQSQSALTNANGNYSANLPTGNWEIKPAKTGGRGVAVSSLDAARVLQVVAGTSSMNALQQLACDVTGDGSLSALDAARILQFSAGTINQFPVAQTCGSDWIFSPRPGAAPNQSVVTPLLTAGSCRQGKILLSPANASVSNQNFDAILFGDCTGNWSTANGGAFRLYASSGTSVHAGPLRYAPGDGLRLPLYVRDATAFNALDITIAYDSAALTVRSVRPRGGAMDALLAANTEEPGLISISLASAEPIDGGAAAVLILEFEGDADLANSPSPQLVSAQIDEQPAGVVTHGND